jgi:Pyridoxal-dependent decarboxylase conserved domain
MDVGKLEEEIMASLDRGDEPMLVNATAGTTVLGAFDPLMPIADLCEKYEIWLHVDVRWCFFVIFISSWVMQRKELIVGSLGRWSVGITEISKSDGGGRAVSDLIKRFSNNPTM